MPFIEGFIGDIDIADQVAQAVDVDFIKTKLITMQREKAFGEIKRLVTNTPLLSFYDPGKELVIQCDASQSGLGAVLMQDGKPVSFASRAMPPT